MGWGWKNGILRSSLLSRFDGLVHGVSSLKYGNARVPGNLVKFAGNLSGVGFPCRNFIVRGEQVHSATVRIIDGAGLFPATDGLLTCKQGLLLCILVADCAPVFLVEPDLKVLIALHMGWRGYVKGILQNAVRLAKSAFGINPVGLSAAIGPHIKRCCFEVDWSVARRFPSVARQRRGGDSGKWSVDLGQAIHKKLVDLGLDNKNVDLCSICTRDDDRLFSFRRNGTDKRIAAIIGYK